MSTLSEAETTLLAILDRTLQGQPCDLARMVFERAAAALRNSVPLTRDQPARLRMQREQVAEDDRDAFDAALSALERTIAVPRTQIIRPPTRQPILVTPEEPEDALRTFAGRFNRAPSGVYLIHIIVTHRAVDVPAQAVQPAQYTSATYHVVYGGPEPPPDLAIARLNEHWAALAGHTSIPAFARLAVGVDAATAAWKRACAALGIGGGDTQIRRTLDQISAGAEPECARLLNLRGPSSIDQVLAAMYDLTDRLVAELVVNEGDVAGRVQEEIARALGLIARAGNTVPEDREARAWLLNASASQSPLAAERFRTREDALVFVAQLYSAGAQRITVENVREQGAYALGLVVTLPEDRGVSADFWQTLEHEGRDHRLARPEERNGQLLLRWS